MKKPRPFSCGFHHQPASGVLGRGGAASPLGTMSNRPSGTVPPGHTMVPEVAELKASEIVPAFTTDENGRYAPPSVCPPRACKSSPTKSEPSSDVRPEATYQLERPVAS